MFKFKTPCEKTCRIMAEVAENNADDDFEANAIAKIKDLTKHEEARITSSGNNSILVALSAIEGDIIIPDQGGWHGFKQIARFLNKNIITLKTDQGLIDAQKMDDLEINENSALIFTSFAGYTAEQDVKSISRYCKSNGITTIEDASAGIGDKKNKLGNGKYSDVIIASTGSPKMINVGSGGFITASDSEIFEKTRMAQKLSKTNEIVCSGIYSELDNVKNNLEVTLNATEHVKKHIPDVIHSTKRGVNVIIAHDDAKHMGWELKKALPLDKSSMITTCPNYNRLKAKAICLEIKNLDYSCLEKENLEIIIEKVNSLL